MFVDIDSTSYNVTEAALAAAVTPNTTAIIVVHLHGLPVDLGRITEFARRRGIALVEDAAQAHGATFDGRPVGSWGDVGSFSLNVSKNLATCGEGGLVTTNDPTLYQQALMMRQFGEIIPHRGRHRSNVSHMTGWNLKPGALTCAFTRSQLRRFPKVDAVRRANIARLLGRLDNLPGLHVPSTPPDRTHAWHILRFGVEPAGFDLDNHLAGPLRQVIMDLLRAEGVAASLYQALPLPAQPPLRRHVRPGQEFPATRAVIDSTFTIQKAHLHPDAGPLLERYADAFEKICAAAERVRELTLDAVHYYEPPWEEAARMAAAESQTGGTA